jgi:hypothetical protein
LIVTSSDRASAVVSTDAKSLENTYIRFEYISPGFMLPPSQLQRAL